MKTLDLSLLLLRRTGFTGFEKLFSRNLRQEEEKVSIPVEPVRQCGITNPKLEFGEKGHSVRNSSILNILFQFENTHNTSIASVETRRVDFFFFSTIT